MPDSFFSSVLMDEQHFRLPPLGEYAVGMVGWLVADVRNDHLCPHQLPEPRVLCHDWQTSAVLPGYNHIDISKRPVSPVYVISNSTIYILCTIFPPCSGQHMPAHPCSGKCAC